MKFGIPISFCESMAANLNSAGYNHNPEVMYPENQSQLAEIKVSYSHPQKSSERHIISSSKDAHSLFVGLWSEQLEFREEFLILLLNRANHVLGWFKVSEGGATGTVVDPKIVFSVALKCMAHAIILCHNHPSGNRNPSEADLRLTAKLKKGGELLDIAVLDHIIIIPDSYFSFSDEGIL